MYRLFGCCLFLVSFIVNKSQAQLAYSVPVSIDQSQLCDQVVGLKDNTGLFTVYPNPSSDIIQVTSPAEGRLYFYNTTGAELFSVGIQGGTSSIDIRKLKPALYMLRVEVGDKQMHVKLIKE